MRTICTAAAVLLSISSAAIAAEAANVRWSHSVEEAWRNAGSLDRPMVVFVTRAGCLPCARMKTTTFVDDQVAQLMNNRYVCVALDGSQPTPLLRDLQVHAVPATFIISPQAVILDRIEGYLPPQALATKLASITPQQNPPSAQPNPPAPQPSATARAF